jgi:SAM-dependent methyltransferase
VSIERERATSFGRVADLYERRRPGYPAALFDDLLAAVPGAGRVLEAGCGTGRATVELARRGFEVVAVEPDPAMAAVARRMTRGLDVRLCDGRFEDWDGPAQTFDLVVSAQAWHWVEFEPGLAVVRRALRAGGLLAVWWNRNGRWEGELRDAIEQAYRRHAPELARDFAATPAFASGHALPGFTPLQTRAYDWTHSYDAASFVELLGTHSDHLLLPSARLEALGTAVSEAIERVAGGRLEFPYRTHLLTARRLAPDVAPGGDG